MVVTALGLSPTGKTQVFTSAPGGPHEADQYDVGIIIPSMDESQAPLTISALPVLDARLHKTQGFHALLGRDVLALCALFYNGSERAFTLAY